MTISKEVLDELLSGVENADDLLGNQGLMKELKVRLMERMLGAGLVPLTFRSLSSFRQPFVQRPRDFCPPAMNDGGAGYRTY